MQRKTDFNGLPSSWFGAILDRNSASELAKVFPVADFLR